MVLQCTISDLHNGPNSNSQFLTKSDEDKMEVNNSDVSMETNGIIDNKNPPTGPKGDKFQLTDGPKYDDIKLSNGGDNFVNIDTVKKPYSDFIHLDNMSAVSGESGGLQETFSNASMTASRSSSNKSPDNKQEKDKDSSHKKDKEKDREERIRQQKEKMAEERHKKLEEMKEQQRLAQEKREKQLELRRMKIEELKRRDEERRMAVEDRRRRQETEEMARRESIIQKSAERITRFEQWKASGRKGTFGGGAPPNKSLSMSTSVLYNKRSSDIGGSTGNLSVKDRPGSLLALNTITEKRRSFIAGAGPPPTRPKSSINLHSKENIKLRERSTPRKPRPSSVATSMPSFMHVESPSPKMRSKSSDRLNRDKLKSVPPQPKFTPKKDKDKPEKDDKKKFDPRKLLAEKRKADQQKKAEEAKKEGTPEKSDKPIIKISQASIDRLSAPKQAKPVKAESPTKPEPTKTPSKPIKQKGKENKETPLKEKKSEKVASSEKLDTKEELKPASKPSTPTRQARAKDGSPSKMQVSFDSSILSSTDAISNDQLFESIEDQTLPEMDTSTSESSAKEAEKAANLDDSLNKDIEEIQDTEVVAGDICQTEAEQEVVKEKSMSPIPDVVPRLTEEKKDESDKEKVDLVKTFPIEPMTTSTPAKEPRDSSPAAKPGTPASTTKSQKELELEEYRAKLAEKRRQAREKAEREAELERQRQEEMRLEQEERQRKEEEEQKRIEEEAERLAEEARRLEGERLRKAIEAEEQRRQEEADRAEQEKIAREEAEKKQKEDAERMEKERIEKIKKDEEERNERKKKLAAIMSKVKSDKNLAASDSNLSTSSMTTSQSLSNLATSEDEQSGEELTVQDSTPKFKSPLLQKLVENKQNGSGNETPKFKSPLLQSLLGKKGRLAEKLESEKTDTNSQKCDTDTNTSNEGREVTQISTDGNSDASDSSENSVISAETINSGIHNGHIKEMVDSSISMKTVDSLGTSVTDSSLYGSLTESASTADHKLEQIIDLNVTNAKYNTTDDLLNCNTSITFDNQGEETLPKPIIAFEDNATRRQEVADFL